MFENFFDSPARVKELRSRPSGRLLEGFAKNLYQKGYAEITARKHIRAAEHFMYWTDRDGIPVSRLSDIFLERFDSHLHQCHCHGFGHYGERYKMVREDRKPAIPGSCPSILSPFYH